jgi:hypothetical protein
MDIRQFLSSDTFKNFLFVIAIVVAIILILQFLNKKEGFEGVIEGEVLNEQIDDADNVTGIIENNTAETVTVEENETKLNNVPLNQTSLPYPQPSNGYDVKTLQNETLIAEDLKPNSDPNNTWNAVNPEVKGTLEDRNFIDAGYHIGIDTQGSSLKLPYTDIRSLPPIPKRDVGPWNQSSWDDPSINRLPFEIGSGVQTTIEGVENL